MERIYTLIDRLYQQKQLQASPAHLLLTVQLLQSELSKLQQKNGSIGTSKVAVTLPTMSFAEEVVESPASETEKVQPASVEEQTIAQPFATVHDEKQYSLRKPSYNDVVEQKVPIKEEPKTFAEHHVLNPAFDAIVEAPIFSQYQPKKEEEVKSKKEVHELISVQQESLNDRLKEEKRELAHVLTGAPIKDLRKAIGINDRFTLVNDLFRGDDVMYERSIKTINSFNILSEAEYWINRELKYKLGWNDNNETVQYFYHLVKRRFS